MLVSAGTYTYIASSTLAATACIHARQITAGLLLQAAMCSISAVYWTALAWPRMRALNPAVNTGSAAFTMCVKLTAPAPSDSTAVMCASMCSAPSMLRIAQSVTMLQCSNGRAKKRSAAAFTTTFKLLALCAHFHLQSLLRAGRCALLHAAQQKPEHVSCTFAIVT
jgi:hypothetical protein